MSQLCLADSALDVLCPSGNSITCCSNNATRSHTTLSYSYSYSQGRISIAFHQCGGKRRFGFRELAYFRARVEKTGRSLLVFRFRASSTNGEPQQQQQQVELEEEEEFRGQRSWQPLGVSHKVGEIVGDKYRIVSILGQGGVGTTYEAEIIADGTTVALKALSLRNMKVWKDLELFEREARVLKSLRHPNIPEYIDYFQVDSASDRAFYIAQKVAKGSSLADLVRTGWRCNEEEVLWVGLEILQVLKYLGSLRPPVYHRDIKPENVIVDMEARTVKVVDFGAVQDAASVTLVGSTVVGTYGYMAPEQFQNRATSQTDLYGLGGTLLFLLSGQSPSSFPQKRLKVNFSSVPISPRLAAVIDRLLEPAPEDRFQSPLEVIKALKDINEPAKVVESMNFNGSAAGLKRRDNGGVLKRPAGTKVDLQRAVNGLEITIPPVGFTAEAVGTGTFAVAWNAFVALWTKMAWSQGIFALFSLPFWFVGIMLAGQTLSQVSVTVKVTIDERKFAIEWRVGNFWKHRVDGNTMDIITENLIVTEVQNGRPRTTCTIVEGVNRHSFGSGLEIVEKKWIIQEIRNFLGFPPEDPGELLSYQSRARTFRRSDPWDD
ncbi:unnamed protein product [Calypogeia fissa]